MKVWLVFGGEYEQWFLVGAFSSPEKAQDCLKEQAEREENRWYIHSDGGETIDESLFARPTMRKPDVG